MIHTITACYKNIFLRQPETRDLELLRLWRNDAANSKYMSKVGYITERKQAEWFEKYLADNNHCMFVVEETNELYRTVGSVSLYDFRPGLCECGKFMVGDKTARGKGIGRLGMTLALYVGFEVFKLNAIDFVVHEDNISALTTVQKAGSIIVGEHTNPIDSGKMEMELFTSRDYFYEKHDFLSKVALNGAPATADAIEN